METAVEDKMRTASAGKTLIRRGLNSKVSIVTALPLPRRRPYSRSSKGHRPSNRQLY